MVFYNDRSPGVPSSHIKSLEQFIKFMAISLNFNSAAITATVFVANENIFIKTLHRGKLNV
jgi:hypothetical protein